MVFRTTHSCPLSTAVNVARKVGTAAAVVGLAFALVTLLARSTQAEPRPADFGRQWVRSHPFTIMALNQGVSALDLDQYQSAGINVLLPWWNRTASQASMASDAGLPWHALTNQTEDGLTDSVISKINQIAAVPGGNGWLVEDEPDVSIFPQVAEVADYLKQNFPDMLVHTNSKYSSNWDAYLTAMVDTIDPDLLMYDDYPFKANGSTSRKMFKHMMAHRNKALEVGIPYWAFIQTFQDDGRRMPSESDVRMHVYSHLTAGFTGLSYFAYHFLDIEHDVGLASALLDQNDQPTPAYFHVAGVNPEIDNLGQSLRFLTSTDVRFVPGRSEVFGIPFEHSAPEGLSKWSQAAGGDALITNVDVDHLVPESFGSDKDGLIGFFVGDAGQRYFMLTNLWHAANTSANDTGLTFAVDFDDNVDELLVLNRSTGEQEAVPLVDHRLTVALPGGTGNLYKYNTGDFVVPEKRVLRGDCNGDEFVDISDATFYLRSLFSGGEKPDCPDACSTNGDTVNDVSDAVFLLLFLFRGGPAPQPVFADCDT